MRWQRCAAGVRKTQAEGRATRYGENICLPVVAPLSEPEPSFIDGALWALRPQARPGCPRPRGGVVTQRSAKPFTPVQFRAWPPAFTAAQLRLGEPCLPAGPSPAGLRGMRAEKPILSGNGMRPGPFGAFKAFPALL